LRQEKAAAPLLSRPFPALLFVVAAILVASAAGLAWRRAANDRAHLVTGEARWIWFTLDFPEEAPLRFRAWREFRLNSVPPSSRAKLFVDPRGILTVNATAYPPIEQHPGDPLRVLDLTPALVAGDNRILIEAESRTGAGGILFDLELAGGRSLVSDSSWRVARLDGVRVGETRPAAVWGRPPMYPWGYLKP
jgi:hypothetical protein